jgi:hypothetical protein
MNNLEKYLAAKLPAPKQEPVAEYLSKAYQLATAKEREARQAAQIENEELKARLARADLEKQRAVLAAKLKEKNT